MNDARASSVDIAQQKWDTEDVDLVRRVAWLSLATISGDIWERFAPGEPPVELVARKLRSLGRSDDLAGVAVVCGDMQGERTRFKQLPGLSFKSVDGYDISGASMARYSPPSGIEWRAHVENCNRLQLPEASFDLAVAWHGVHADLLHEYLRYCSPIARNLHGGLTYPVFEGIAQNFDEHDSHDVMRIGRIVRLERYLARLGVIDPLFVVSLGVRKEAIVGVAQGC